MTSDEIISKNKEVLLDHLNEVEFNESFQSRESSAGSLAEWFTNVSEKPIDKVSSEPRSKGGLLVTVTDTEGDTFTLYVGKDGALTKITDAEGKTIFGVME